MKRLFDCALILIFCPLLIPIFGILSLLVLLKHSSPVIFQQMRVGKDNKIFKMYKFRSMSSEKDSMGNLLPDSERLAPFGRLLRSTSLDELPELINVLKGEMSLVGPRPLLVEYIPYYDKEQGRRHLVRPGITGWAQVNGRNALSWEEKFKLDTWYVDNQSLWLDIRIIFLTVKKVFLRDGITPMGSESVMRFDDYIKNKLNKG